MKKWIKLTERADIGGEVRSPEEGEIAVAAKHADALIAAGKAKPGLGPNPDLDARRSAAAKKGAETRRANAAAKAEKPEPETPPAE